MAGAIRRISNGNSALKLQKSDKVSEFTKLGAGRWWILAIGHHRITAFWFVFGLESAEVFAVSLLE